MALGSPTGRILIDDADVTRARNAVVAAARDISQAFKSTDGPIAGLATGIRVAQVVTDQFANTSLGVLSKGLKDAADSFKYFSAGAALAVAGGISAAQSVKTLQVTYQALSGSATEAQKRLDQVRQVTDAMKLPFLETANGAVRFLTVLNSSNASMQDLVTTASKLRLLAPEKTAEDAAFALKELLAGQVMSITNQFNLSREAVKNIKDQANGDAATTVKLLNDYLGTIGLTDAALKKMGDSGVYAFEIASDAAKQAAATAFTPLLNDVIVPLLTKFSALALAADPDTLKLGAGLLVGAAAIAPLLFGLNQAIEAYKTLKILSAIPLNGIGMGAATVGGAVAYAGVGAIALTVGVTIGEAIAKALADANVTTQQAASPAGLGDTTKELFLLLTKGASDLVVSLVSLAMRVGNGADHIEDAIHILALRIEDGGAAIMQGIGGFLKGLGDQYGIATLANFGKALQKSGDDTRNGTPVTGTPGGPITSLGSVGTIAQIQGIEAKGSDPLALTAAQQAQLDQMTRGLEGGFIKMGQALGVIAQDTVAAAGDATGNIDSAGKEITGALKAMLGSDSWQKIIDNIKEFGQKVAEETDQVFIDTTREARDYATSHMREIADMNTASARRYQDELEQEQKKIDDLKTVDDEATKKEVEARQKAHDQEADALKDHLRRLYELERDSSENLLDALAAGNFTAAQKAIRDFKDKSDDENYQYGQAKKVRDATLAETIKGLEDERAAKKAADLVDLADMKAQFDKEEDRNEEDTGVRLEREAEDRATRQSDLQADLDERRRIEKEANDRQLADLWTKVLEDANANGVFQTQFSNLLDWIRSNVLAKFTSLGQQAASSLGAGFTVTQSAAPTVQYGPGFQPVSGFTQSTSPAPTVQYATGYNNPSNYYVNHPTAQGAGQAQVVQNALDDFYAQYNQNAGKGPYTPTAFATGGMVTKTGMACVDEGETIQTPSQRLAEMTSMRKVIDDIRARHSMDPRLGGSGGQSFALSVNGTQVTNHFYIQGDQGPELAKLVATEVGNQVGEAEKRVIQNVHSILFPESNT